MNHPVQVPDLFATGLDDVPTEQERVRRAVEDLTFASVQQQEREKAAVTVDHVGAQARVWGLRDDHMRPVELGTGGRNG